MTFKIVQTLERGKLVLSAVPEKWEQNGILYWPRRKVEDLLKNPFSCPEASWSSIQCVVKRSGISSLERAEKEVTQMSSMSDTEEEQNDDLIRRGGTSIENIAVQECFNDLANACDSDADWTLTVGADKLRAELSAPIVSVKLEPAYRLESHGDIQTVDMDLGRFMSIVNNSQYLQPSTSNATNIDDVVVLTSNQEIDQNQHSVILHTTELDHLNISQKLDNLLQITGIIQENQNVLFEYVQSVESKLLMKMTHLSTQLDEYVQRTTDIKIQEANDFKPISNKEELDNLEDKLKNPTMVSTLKNKLAVVCGNGKGRGGNNQWRA